ncbi:hypothetical protein T484DRAFT_2185562 [Baffinella frigidus]|nr:hypothetical protein T484DRAFT_2185562 [Cryptophyta sp. CCMP2293]
MLARSSRSASLRGGAPAAASLRMASREVIVEADVDAVGKRLCAMVEEAAGKAIKERGSFSLAIPGGSILKMLKGLQGKSSIEWDKSTMAYVNHRCVALDDETSTHFKARPLFLDSWMEQGLKVITLEGTTDAPKEAAAYAAAMKV